MSNCFAKACGELIVGESLKGAGKLQLMVPENMEKWLNKAKDDPSMVAGAHKILKDAGLVGDADEDRQPKI